MVQARFDDALRDEITALQEQISTKREENDMEEVRRLQDQLRDKVCIIDSIFQRELKSEC